VKAIKSYKYPFPENWEIKLDLPNFDGEIVPTSIGYGGFRFYTYESIASVPFPASRFQGSTKTIKVKDTISQSIIGDNVRTEVCMYLPLCTSAMYYTIHTTKDGKFFSSKEPTIRAMSDGHNWNASLNKEGQLHSVFGPAYHEPDFRSSTNLYFINGVQYQKEEWEELDEVKNVLAMENAIG